MTAFRIHADTYVIDLFLCTFSIFQRVSTNQIFWRYIVFRYLWLPMYHLSKDHNNLFNPSQSWQRFKDHHLPPYEIHRLPPALEDHNLVEAHRRPLFVFETNFEHVSKPTAVANISKKIRIPPKKENLNWALLPLFFVGGQRGMSWLNIGPDRRIGQKSTFQLLVGNLKVKEHHGQSSWIMVCLWRNSLFLDTP